MSGWAAVGGSIGAGVVMATLGAIAVAETSHVRTALRRSDWPAVSTAMACIVQSLSYGTVTSYCQVALVAPTTSGTVRNVLYVALVEPSSCR